MTDSVEFTDGHSSPSESRERLPPTLIGLSAGGFRRLVDTPVLSDSRYQLREELEHGGMGTIFIARDEKLARDVAIKVLRMDPQASVAAKAAYANEARIMSYLSHPGVVPIYDCGITTDDCPYHVMKLIHGMNLRELLSGRQSTAAHRLSIFADICQTMAFAHSRGVVHLDLKPANIMVGSYGEVYVMDWGLAQFESSATADVDNRSHANADAMTQFCIAGTPEYMSPEQARGESLDARADVFGLGALLCEILIGHSPYSGKSVQQVHHQALCGSMGAAMEGLEVCDTDRALVRLTKRCLASNRQDRPRDAVQVAREVAAYQETALERMENDMNRFFELSLDLFCIADFEGFFHRINSNFSRVLGYSERELLARPYLEFVHEDDLDQTVAKMGVLKEGHPVVRFTNRYRTAGGNYATLEWTAKAIDDEKIIFAVARDVSAA